MIQYSCPYKDLPLNNRNYYRLIFSLLPATIPRMGIESNRYDPRMHGDPNAFIYESGTDNANIHLRKSSVLAAAFTPLMRDFKEKLGIYPPSALENMRENVGVGRYPYLGKIPVSEIFDTPLSNHSAHFSYFSEMIETDYLDPTDYRGPLRPTVTVPIGFYGEKFAEATAVTAAVLSRLASKIMTEESDQLFDSHYQQTIRNETFMVIPSTVLAEGMQTIAAGVGLLTAQGIPGYKNDPIGGMQQLVDQKVFQHFAALSPSGIIILMTQEGLRFKEPLTVDNDGILKINSQLLEIFKQEKVVKVETGKGRLSEGCPVARPNVPEVREDGSSAIIKNSGVQMGMDAFMEHLRYYYSNS